MSESIESTSKTNKNNFLKQSKTLISSRIIFNSIILMKENNNDYKSNYYISLIVSNLSPQNSNIIEFSKDGECKNINQPMSLDNGESIKKFIKIELCQKEKQLYSNIFLKGEIINENYIYDNASGNFICYLYNNEGIKKAIVYFTINYKSSKETNDDYYKNVKRIEKVYKRSLTNENNIHNLFIINLQYIKLISNDINSIFNWTDKWRTLSLLFAFTFIIIFFKIFYVFVLPLYIIFFHINNKNNIEKFILTKDRIDNTEKKVNEMIFYRIMYIYNKIVNIYENIISKIINGKQIMIEYYMRIGIAIITNVCFFHFKLYNYINFKILIITIVWFYVLRRNPSFYSFSIFINNIVQERALFITYNHFFLYYKTNFINLIITLIPLYSLYRLYTEEINDSSIFILKENENKDNNLIKYEIYENERWWMFVGWDKNLIMDETQIWCKSDKPKEYFDKNMVKLPRGENKYKWNSDWKIELSNNTDDNGWEYSKDFGDPFERKSAKQKVRRRKWVRYAIKI